ncbi:MAG: protein phosphatase 2C domain-containing protein [Planctomycetales bacterium]|nr:protein phosphatase 2C domain-containing protein [Planctomycetales bacterium]
MSVSAHRWSWIGQSVTGKSHRGEGAACQDAHAVRDLGEAKSALIACVADGAGSAKHGGVGARLACEAIMSQAVAHFESAGDFLGVSRDMAIAWCSQARERIRTHIDGAGGGGLRDYASTLCVALLDDECGCFFQIGDGAAVVRNAGVWGVVFWPQSGEYANSTNFLTSESYYERLDHCLAEGRFDAAALITDGLERLALSFDCQTLHEPFLAPLINALQTAEEPSSLQSDLERFLQSAAIESRSDDDKTLVFACRKQE